MLISDDFNDFCIGFSKYVKDTYIETTSALSYDTIKPEKVLQTFQLCTIDGELANE